MKKTIIAAAFAATAALTMSNAFASAGTVNFTGEIIDAACTVDAGSVTRPLIWAVTANLNLPLLAIKPLRLNSQSF